ncbi:lytic transglycosylase domain-containing protein [Azospirillum sp. RWY-5-1]|uniref:Lytic transglycosylase domain-containing protein n=1 Tax=Azospirillum oleiclasticum TaxID=2735135 RepID=A0ABX2T5N4_9PROT|nr:lytic transglycosylase domain-containing protein [Azospirillum oleiclasticum]NYZ11990.1 lytic transglycosylase domain-containing protein [Azospirillum oleiclasticum]NYZ19150.1 lytic transglycosylase domain-containing protein [Azospirillum oleiclasticum]
MGAGKSTRAALRAGLLSIPLTLAAALPAAAAPLSQADITIYRDAFRAADNDRHDEALRLASRAKDPLPAKVIRWMQLATPAGGSFDEIAAFIRDNGDWPNMTQLRRQAEKAMPLDMDENRVLAWFRDYPPQSNEGVMRYADTLLATGGEEQAVKLVRARWVEGSFGPTDEAEFLGRYRSHLRKQDHVTRFDRLLWERQETSARRMLDLLGEGYDALLDARMALDGDRGGADAAFARVPSSLRNDPGLLFDRARWLRRKGDDDGALAIFLKPPPELGRQQSWWGERHILARRAIERGDYRMAYRIASTHRQEDGVTHMEAEFLAGWLALRFLDQPSEAFKHFHTLYRTVTAPISRARGAYWCGRAAEALGNREQAREWFTKASGYGTTFYGQLAVSNLGGSARVTVPEEPKVANAQVTAFERREVVQVIRQLVQISGRENDRLTGFLRRISLDAKSPADYVLAGRLARDVGRPDLAVAAAKDAAQNEVYLTEVGYPLVSASRNATEVSLVHAIIRQESTFNTNVVSSAGARGLMQLMPTTAQLVAKQLGIRHTHARLTADPDYNVLLGSTYIGDLVDRFNGSYVLAIAGYNAGPGRVRQWIDQFGDPRTEAIDVVDWMELIPIYETRNYVQRVLEALLVYRSKLQGGRAELDMARELRR